MNDLLESRNKAMIRQGWQFGDKMSRIGHPFEWVDGDKQGYIYSIQGVPAVLQAYSMYYEKYETPKEILVDDYKEMLSHLEGQLGKLLSTLAPFLLTTNQWKMHQECTALARCQDYAAIKTYCANLPKNIVHIDLGPGLGSHAFYSLKAFNSSYIGVEASLHMYQIQRSVYRFIAAQYGSYFDVVECENFSMPHQDINNHLKALEHKLTHVPSWYFCDIKDQVSDLVTATWMLNETNHAGVLWLMSNAMRSLKVGGYFYIRDSENLKPLRHQINYDKLLQNKGFEKVVRLDVKNRINFFGVPRIYKKVSHQNIDFDSLSEEYLGKFAITSHGGEYNQNMGNVKEG